MSKPKIKKLTNVELLNELPFYKSLSIKEVSEAFTRYAKSYSIEIAARQDPLVQLISSKLTIKDLFKNLLDEISGFKYHIIVNATLHKDKLNDNSEDASVYFNSKIKTVINLNFEDSIDECFEEILYRVDDWINKGSGWVTESVNKEYVNISKYSPLLGSSYIELPDKLNHPKNGLINMRNNDNKCFLWCHVRHLNPVSNHSTRITRVDREIADTLDYSNVNFPVCENDYSDVEDINNICVNVFSYDGRNVYPIYISSKNYEDFMDILLIFGENGFHYVYINDFNGLIFNKTKNKNKKHFCRYCLQCFTREDVLN